MKTYLINNALHNDVIIMASNEKEAEEEFAHILGYMSCEDMIRVNKKIDVNAIHPFVMELE
jgi:hypothetical protein